MPYGDHIRGAPNKIHSYDVVQNSAKYNGIRGLPHPQATHGPFALAQPGLLCTAYQGRIAVPQGRRLTNPPHSRYAETARE